MSLGIASAEFLCSDIKYVNVISYYDSMINEFVLPTGTVLRYTVVHMI